MFFPFRRPRVGGVVIVSGFAALAALLACPAMSRAQDAPPPAPVVPQAAPAQTAKIQAVSQATWDSNFVYFVVQVGDGDVLGTASQPLSPKVGDDDGIGVYFQTGSERPDAPNAQTHAMLVSAAGGFQFLQGDNEKKALVPLPLFTIKYGVSVQGTLNRSDDRDKGYTISLAVPLSALGLDGTLTPGTEVGFNLMVRSRSSKGVAASALAGTPDNPGTWVKLVLAAPDASAASTPETIIAPRVNENQRPPAIDGNYRADAWPVNSRFAVALPEAAAAAPVAIAPAVPSAALADTVAPEVNEDALKAGVSRLIFARYILNYQGDRRKTNVPTRGVWGANDTLLLAHQPVTGVGPWFSSDRVSYHQTQMTEMRRAGIDVALTEMGGPNALLAASIMDSKALLVLVAALREMSASGVAAPRLALLLDTASLTQANAAPIDLSKESGQDTVYAAIKRWFELVPPEYRAQVTLPGGANASGAFPVFFTGGTGTQIAPPAGGEWASEIRKHFARDFGPATGGATLLFVGSDAPAAAGFAANLPANAAGGIGTGNLPAYVIVPNGVKSSGRTGGDSYRKAWDDAFAAKPEWIVINSWNDFTQGTEITPSRQFGSQFADLTRILTISATGLPEQAVRFPANDVPKRMRPGQVISSLISVQNAGATPLSSANGASMVYRWRKAGVVVAENPINLPLPVTLLPTQTAQIPVGLLAAKLDTSTGQFSPLEPGEYTVEFDVSRTNKSAAPGVANPPVYFGELPGSDGPLQIPVSIVPDLPDSVDFGSSTLSPILVTGGTYPASVRVRWRGDKALGLNDARLVYQLQSLDGKTIILSGSLPLNRPLNPGQWETVSGPVALVDSGSPIAPACPELTANGGASGYKLRWLLTRTDSTDAIGGGREETVAVYPETDEARISPPPPPDALQASSLQNMSVSVTNQGQTTWKKGDFSVGYHWYYVDGAEAAWKPNTTAPIPREVKPGETVKLSVPVRAPDRDGDYILAFDVLRAPDIFLSTLPVSRTGDTGLIPVRVLGGHLVFADLTKYFNIDGSSGIDAPTRTGDLDNKGNAFPGESFPPDPFGIVAYLAARDGETVKKQETHPTAYPSGYFSDFSPNARLVGFRYGQENKQAKNAIACDNQVIALPSGKYFGLHFAALSTSGADVPLTITVRYKDKTVENITRPVGDWHKVPSESDAALIALQTQTTRSQTNGDTPTPCVLRHIVFNLAPTKEVESLTLPKNADVKVFAITLEK